MRHRTVSTLIGLGLFAVAMAYLEAAVVVYLRDLFYPEGFTFPLKAMPVRTVLVELGRELATMVMLGAVAFVAAREFWRRFAVFVFMFGIWDVFYYVWLKVTLGWPVSLNEWDVLFLIPLPWIAPVYAPVCIAVLMTIVGIHITRMHDREISFRPGWFSWTLAAVATGLVLLSFLKDTNATLRLAMPQPYPWWLLVAGLICYMAGFMLACRRSAELKSRS